MSFLKGLKRGLLFVGILAVGGLGLRTQIAGYAQCCCHSIVVCIVTPSAHPGLGSIQELAELHEELLGQTTQRQSTCVYRHIVQPLYEM